VLLGTGGKLLDLGVQKSDWDGTSFRQPSHDLRTCLVQRIPTGSVLALYGAQVAAVGVAMTWNFGANRLVTYNDVKIGR